MKTLLITLSALLPLVSCGGGTVRTAKQAITPVQPKQYTYTVRNTYPHLTTSYTQGLQYIDGVLWEGTGQHGESVVQQIDLKTGKATVITRLPQSEFGEGITVLGDHIYQLTWQSNTAHVYDRTTGEKLRDFRYPGEGWGLTTDGKKLYMSNGTEYIYTLDPATFKREKSVAVTLKGEPVRFLNELEWIGDRIWANVYTTEQIVIINPVTGVVEGIIDLTGILPESEITATTDVLNGIAYDAEQQRIFVTGKNWDKIFEITINEQ